MSYQHRADVVKNRLYVAIRGFMDVREATESSHACLAEARKLRPGFDIVTDIAEAKPGNDDVAKVLGLAQVELAKLRPGRVVRVVGKARIAQMQFERTAKAAGYAADTVGTVEEAEKLLGR